MIRPHVQAVICHQGKIFVLECKDTVKGITFYRAPSGGIEFGETSQEALKREMQEEFGASLNELHFLGVVENIFDFENTKGHEVIFFYTGMFMDDAMFKDTQYPILDSDTGYAVWKPIDDFLSNKETLYPKEILDYLREVN